MQLEMCNGPRRQISPARLRDAGYSAREILTSGGYYPVRNLIDSDTGGGFSIVELKDAGVDAAALKPWVTLSDLKNAGYSATELKQAKFNALELRRVGFTLQEMFTAEFSSLQLFAAGYYSPLDIRTYNAAPPDDTRSPVEKSDYSSGKKHKHGKIKKRPVSKSKGGLD